MLRRLLSARKKQQVKTGVDLVAGALHSGADASLRGDGQLHHPQPEAGRSKGEDEDDDEDAAWHGAFMAGLVRRRVAGALQASGALAVVGGAEAAVGRVLEAADRTSWLKPENLRWAAAAIAIVFGGGVLLSPRARKAAEGMLLGGGLGAGAASVGSLLVAAAVLQSARDRAAGAGRPREQSSAGMVGAVRAVLGWLPELPGGQTTWAILFLIGTVMSMRRGGSLRQILAFLGTVRD